MQSILILKTSAIGDVIQTFPVLQYLRLRYPSAKIDWLVERGSAALVRAHPMIDGVHIVDTKKWKKNPWAKETIGDFASFRKELQKSKYDVVFDLQGNTKSGFLNFFVKAKNKVGFGMRSVAEKPNLLFTNKRFEVPLGVNVRAKYLSQVKQYFKDQAAFTASPITLRTDEEEKKRLQSLLEDTRLEGRFRLMIAFGSNWTNKKLAEDTLLACLKIIYEETEASFIFVYGNEIEKEVAKSLHANFQDTSLVAGEMSLPFWQNFISAVDGVFTVDSAALHLAGTTTTPSFSLFGPSNASIYKPIEDRHAAFQGICPYGRTFEKRCPILRTCSTGACLREVPPEKIAYDFLIWHRSLKAQRARQS